MVDVTNHADSTTWPDKRSSWWIYMYSLWNSSWLVIIVNIGKWNWDKSFATYTNPPPCNCTLVLIYWYIVYCITYWNIYNPLSCVTFWTIYNSAIYHPCDDRIHQDRHVNWIMKTSKRWINFSDVSRQSIERGWKTLGQGGEARESALTKCATKRSLCERFGS